MKKAFVFGLILSATISVQAASFKNGEFMKNDKSCTVTCKPASGSCKDLLNDFIDVKITGNQIRITPGIVEKEELARFTYSVGTHAQKNETLISATRDYTLTDGTLMLRDNSATNTTFMKVEAKENGNLVVFLTSIDKIDKETSNSICTFEKM